MFIREYRLNIGSEIKVHGPEILTDLLKSLPTSGDFCSLLINFANGLDTDQARQNVWPDWIQAV